MRFKINCNVFIYLLFLVLPQGYYCQKLIDSAIVNFKVEDEKITGLYPQSFFDSKDKSIYIIGTAHSPNARVPQFIKYIDPIDSSIVVKSVPLPRTFKLGMQDEIYVMKYDSLGRKIYSKKIATIPEIRSIRDVFIENNILYFIFHHHIFVGEETYDAAGSFIKYNLEDMTYKELVLYQEPLRFFKIDSKSFGVLTKEQGHMCDPPEYKISLNIVSSNLKLLERKLFTYTMCESSYVEKMYYLPNSNKLVLRLVNLLKNSSDSNMCAINRNLFYEKKLSPYYGYTEKYNLYSLPSLKPKKSFAIKCKEGGYFINEKEFVRIEEDFDSLDDKDNKKQMESIELLNLSFTNILNNQTEKLKVSIKGGLQEKPKIITHRNEVFLISRYKSEINVKRISQMKIKNEVSFPIITSSFYDFVPVTFNNFFRIYVLEYETKAIEYTLRYFDVEKGIE